MPTETRKDSTTRRILRGVVYPIGIRGFPTSTSGYKVVLRLRHPNRGSKQYFLQVVNELNRRGLVDDAFFDQLR